jgi:hypothetical protein
MRKRQKQNKIIAIYMLWLKPILSKIKISACTRCIPGTLGRQLARPAP